MLDKSLLQRLGQPDENLRFTMLATIREFALEQLEATAEAGAMHQRHAAFYLDWVETVEPQLSVPDQAVWLERLEAEHDTFVGDSKIESVVGDELARLTPADLGAFGQVVLSAFRRQAVTSPLLQLPADKLVYAFNLVRIPTTAAEAEADWLVKANRAIYERVRAAGGTLYPVSAFPMLRDDWRRHFGSAWERFRDAKRTFDPRHILTPGYEVFEWHMTCNTWWRSKRQCHQRSIYDYALYPVEVSAHCWRDRLGRWCCGL